MQNEMRTHVAVVAWLNIVLGFPMLFIGAIAGLPFLIPGFVVPISLPLFGAIAAGLFLLIAGYGLLGIIGGFGLLNRAPWARVVMIIVSILHLANATSLGLTTIIGIYSLIILFHPDTTRLFD